MWRLTYCSFLDPGFPRFPQTCCYFRCFWQIWNWFWTLLILISTSSEISFELQNLIITWRARCSRQSLSLWFLRPSPLQALAGCHHLQAHMIYIMWFDILYISNIHLGLVATSSKSNMYDSYNIWHNISYISNTYRVFFLTGPPPEFAKCWPVSNWFQKNVRVPDWPPPWSKNV